VRKFSFRLNAVQHFLLKDRRGAITLFDLKDAKVIRGGALSIKCNMIVFFDRAPRRLVSCDLYRGRRFFEYIRFG